MANFPQNVRRDQLVSTIEDKIFAEEYPVGSMLPSERKLAESLGVSRSALREAIRVLAERNLISVEQGRGAVVLAADPAATASAITDAFRRQSVTARDVITGRLVLEAETSRLAAAQHNADDLAAMDRAILQMNNNTSIMGRVKADLAFHLAIAHASRNVVLETMFQAISGLTAEMMLRSLADRAVSGKGLPQHEMIRDAISKGKGTLASKHMTEHIEVAVNYFGKDLDVPLDGVAERELSRVVGGKGTLEDVFRLALAKE